MIREGFIFHNHYYDAIKELPDELRYELYDALFDNVFLGMDYSDNSSAVKALITMIINRIEDEKCLCDIMNCDSEDHGGHIGIDVAIKPDGTIVMDDKTVGRFDSLFMDITKPHLDGKSINIHF